MISRNAMEILSQEISDEESMYRVRAGQRAYYPTISTDVFDEETMCHPYLLIPQLPSFADILESKVKLSRNRDGSLHITTSHDPLQEVAFT